MQICEIFGLGEHHGKAALYSIFDEIGIDDIPLVGGKNASLGEMFQALTPVGVPVPNGFAVTAEAYRAVLTENDLWDKLHDILDPLDESSVTDLAERGQAARQLVYHTDLPQALIDEILDAYHVLSDCFTTPITMPFAARQRRKTCPPPVSPGNRTPTSTSAVRPPCSMPVNAALPACSPTAPSITESTKGSITLMSDCRLASKKWCAPIYRHPA